MLKYRKEAKTIVDGLRETTAYPDLRDSSESVYGIWYTTVDKNMIAYSGIFENLINLSSGGFRLQKLAGLPTAERDPT